MRIRPLPPALALSGKLTFTPTDPPRPLATYVIQRVAPGRGNVPEVRRRNIQLRRHVIPADPRSPMQLARRARMRAAVAEWQAMSQDARSTWNKRAARKARAGFQLFISARLRGQ